MSSRRKQLDIASTDVTRWPTDSTPGGPIISLDTTLDLPTPMSSTSEETSQETSSILVVPIKNRQVLGSPTREVLTWPTTWPWFPVPPSSGLTSRTVSGILTVPPEKRQTLGSPTRTVIIGPTSTPDVIYATTTETVTKTQIVPTTIRTTIISESDIYITTTKISTTTASVTQTVTKSIISTATYITTTTLLPGIGWGTTLTASTTIGFTNKARQELGGGTPTLGISWNDGGDGYSWPTRTLAVG